MSMAYLGFARHIDRKVTLLNRGRDTDKGQSASLLAVISAFQIFFNQDGRLLSRE